MTHLEIWFLAISLAMDCFTVSITSGIVLRKIHWRTCLLTAFLFGLFQALMPLFSWLSAQTFNHLIESFDHWIVFIILTILGIRMIKEGASNEEKCFFAPYKLKVALALAVATSIDALAVGFSFAFIGMDTFKSILSPIFIIGIVSFTMSVIGFLCGVYFGKHMNLKTEILGGVILIIIGTKILFEHLHLI